MRAFVSTKNPTHIWRGEQHNRDSLFTTEFSFPGTVNAFCRRPTRTSRISCVSDSFSPIQIPFLGGGGVCITMQEIRSTLHLQSFETRVSALERSWGSIICIPLWEETPGTEGSEPLACSCRRRPQEVCKIKINKPKIQYRKRKLGPQR